MGNRRQKYVEIHTVLYLFLLSFPKARDLKKSEHEKQLLYMNADERRWREKKSPYFSQLNVGKYSCMIKKREK